MVSMFLDSQIPDPQSPVIEALIPSSVSVIAQGTMQIATVQFNLKFGA
jgi:hypothetical protein